MLPKRVNNLFMKYFAVIICMLAANESYAQSTSDSIKAVVNNLFTAMANADSSLAESCFSKTAILQTIARSREGEVIVRTDKVSDFSGMMNKVTKGDLDEKIEFEKILIDGPMASVWTPYKFYFKGKFSHCGVNSFQLVRFNDDWKIQYLIDTRRKSDCE